MALPSGRIGRAVLELATDNTQYTAGLKQATGQLTQFQAATKRVTFRDMVQGMSSAGREATMSAKLIAGMSTAGYQARVAQFQAAQASQAWTTRLQGLTGQLNLGARASASFKGAFVGAFSGLGAASLMQGAITAVTTLTRRSAEMAGALVDASQRTGISIEGLQRLAFVAGQTGTSFENLQRAAFMVGARIAGGSGSVADAVKDLGLNLAAVQAMRPEDQFAAILDALGRIEDPQRRNELTMRLFGRAAADVLPAVAEGYRKLAAEARVATGAQVAAVDVAVDAWAAAARDIETRWTGALGTIAIGIKGLSQLSKGDLFKLFATTSDPVSAIIALGEARAGALHDEAEAQRLAAGATNTAAAATTDYAKQLAVVRAELAALSPVQRKQLEAAQALGVSTDELENRFGLTEGALRVLTTTTKDNTAATRENAEAKQKQADAFRDFQNFIGEREIEDIERQQQAIAAGVRAEGDALNERLDQLAEFYDRAEDLDRAYRQHLNELGEQEIRDRERQLQQREDIEAAYRRYTNEREEERIQRIADMQAEQRERWRRFSEDLTSSLSGNLADMLVHLRSFKDGFVSIWRDVRASVANVLQAMLRDLVEGYIKRAIAALVGAKLGEKFFGGGGPVGGRNWLQLAPLAAPFIPGLNSAPGPGTPPQIPWGNVPWSQLAGPAVGAGVGYVVGRRTGNTASSIFSGAGSGALTGFMFGGPIGAGIGAIAGAIGGWLGAQSAQKAANRLRDQFLMANWGGTRETAGPRAAAWLTRATGQPGGGSLYAQLLKANDVGEVRMSERAIAAVGARLVPPKRIAMFNMGGIVPPGVTMPAILHGGRRGELVVPLDRVQRPSDQHARQTVVNNYTTIKVDGMISPDTMDEIHRKYIVPRNNTALIRNSGGTQTEILRVVRGRT